MLTEKERDRKCLAMWKKLSESGSDDKNSAMPKEDKGIIAYGCYLCESCIQQWEKETGKNWWRDVDTDLGDVCPYCPLKDSSGGIYYCLHKERFSYSLWREEVGGREPNVNMLKKYAGQFYQELKEVLKGE